MLFSASIPLPSLAQTCLGFKEQMEDPAPGNRPLPREAELLLQGCRSIPPAPWDSESITPHRASPRTTATSVPRDPRVLRSGAGGPPGFASPRQTQQPFFSPPHRCLHSCRPAPTATTPPPGSPAQECEERGAAGLPPTPPAPHGPPGRSPVPPSSHIPPAAALRPGFSQAAKSVSHRTRPHSHK